MASISPATAGDSDEHDKRAEIAETNGRHHRILELPYLLATHLLNDCDIICRRRTPIHGPAGGAFALDRIRGALEHAVGRPAAFGGRLASWLQRLPQLPLSGILETVWPPGSIAVGPVAILTHGEARPRDAVAVTLSREQWLASVSMPPDGWLEIGVSGIARHEPAPLAILTVSSGEGSPLVRQAAWNEAADAWVAVLQGLPSGDYLVAIEP